MIFYYPMLITSIMSMMLSMMMLNNSFFMTLEIPLLMMNNMNFSMSIVMDWYSMMFISTVLFISSMILIFSLTYIPSKEFNQFSMIMMMFVMSMLILILSDNMIMILLGWDGLGLSSYMLVIYYQNFSSASSGSITIFSNRMGDIAFIIAISIMTTKFNWSFKMNEEFPILVMILLTLAAISKSAQFPFSAWLPAAMAAPTPISALVHSSTLVTAGVYLMMRIMNFHHPITMMMIMMISTMTTIYASMTANWEQDMKKIIALSTLSQMGMMMFAISLGMYKLAFFHLIIHAMFKSMMFLTAGMLIHNFSYQDKRHMGVLLNYSPMLMLILTVSNMTLMAIPFLSGFFSKDSIIESMSNSKMFTFMSMMMLMSIGMTASYSMNLMKFSMKLLMKSKTDSFFTNSKMMEGPMLLMTPYSIFMGTLLMWIMFPLQIFFIPPLIKMIILMMMLMGFTMGVNFNFNSKKFTKMGFSSISLWFINFMSTFPMMKSTPSMMVLQKNDKTWQEFYGVKFINLIMNNNKMNPEMNMKSPSFIIMIMLMIPMVLMILT